jgi:hypothetical protein
MSNCISEPIVCRPRSVCSSSKCCIYGLCGNILQVQIDIGNQCQMLCRTWRPDQSKIHTKNVPCFVLESKLRIKKNWIPLLLLWLVVTRTSVKHKICLAPDGLGEDENGEIFGVTMKVNTSVHT